MTMFMMRTLPAVPPDVQACSLPSGGFATSKINLQSLPIPNIYLAARSITLLRTSPTNAALRVLAHAMQSAPGGSVQSNVGDAMYFWTQDNGATCTYTPVISGFPGGAPYGALLVKDETTVLVFGGPHSGKHSATHLVNHAGRVQRDFIGSGQHPQHRIGGQRMVLAVPGDTRLWWCRVPQDADWHDQAGRGAVHPRWWWRLSNAGVLDYPSGRPLLLVSDDDGATWQRRFLPTPWSFLAGFVVSVDQTTLAVPISARRADREQGSRPRCTSRATAATPAAAGASGMLPKQTMTDGQIVAGDPAEEISDCWLQYNRGGAAPDADARGQEGQGARLKPRAPVDGQRHVEKPSLWLIGCSNSARPPRSARGEGGASGGTGSGGSGGSGGSYPGGSGGSGPHAAPRLVWCCSLCTPCPNRPHARWGDCRHVP